MKLLLRRVQFSAGATLGVLTTPFGTYATCEDTRRDHKIRGETCIAPGTYNIQLRTKSGMASAYRERYGADHAGMIWLQDVPEFEYIYIHTGNTPRDTDGCILIGEVLDLKAESIGRSRDAYQDFYPHIFAALEQGERVEITIEDLRPAA